MTWLEMIAVLLLVPGGLVGAGYGWVASFRFESAATRLAFATLTGLCAILFSVSLVNAVLPLAGLWAWICFLPWLLPLLRRECRRHLVADLRTVCISPVTWLCGAGTAVFLVTLLWPLFSRPDLVFYDGSSNHDAFFWVVGAEYLKRSSYLVGPVAEPAFPLYYPATTIAGLTPPWGRMGAEGLLALLSSLCHLSPLKLYVVGTATLLYPWLAATYLVVRTFLSRHRFGIWAVLVVLLQPVFVFFHANSNLPNLVGALCGTLAIVALARALREEAPRAWWVLVALGVHGMLCSYPEAAPAVALPCLVLLGRSWLTRGLRRAAWATLAVAAGLVINPLTTVRAFNGFVVSLGAVNEALPRPSLFTRLPPADSLPAVATLSLPLGHSLNTTHLGIGCSVVLLALAGLVVTKARDRLGALAVLSSVALMVAFTLVTHFGYGWQKAVQFSAIPVVAIWPAAGVLVLAERLRQTAPSRAFAAALLSVVIATFSYATVANIREAHKWSHRKYLTRDWFAAAGYSRKALRNSTVVIDSRNFEWPFFYTMWASYFLTESRLLFAGDYDSGGYLRIHFAGHEHDWIARPRAILVSPHAVAGAALRPKWMTADVAFLPASAASGGSPPTQVR